MIPAVREFEEGDAVAVAEVIRASAPYWLVTAELIRWQAAAAPRQRFQLLVAEVTAWSSVRPTGLHESAERAGLRERQHASDRRGREPGSALLAAAEER
jgi:hypothetical protein